MQELSELLNRLGEHLGAGHYERYRNPNGVYMKFMNFRRLDPEYPDSRGLAHGGRLEQAIWNEFASDPLRCRDAAQAIRLAIDALGEGEEEDTDLDEGFEDAEEGRAVTRLHVRRERNRKLVKRKKESVLKRAGKLECEACGFDFNAIYGERVSDVSAFGTN